MSADFPGDWKLNAVVIDPRSSNLLYLGTSHGVYRSADGGQSWEQFKEGMPDCEVLCLAMTPSAPYFLYAGTYGFGLFAQELDNHSPRVIPAELNSRRLRESLKEREQRSRH
jgi:hypothetical protein